MSSTLRLVTCCLLVIAAVHSFKTNSRYLDVVDPCFPNQVHIALGDAYYNSLANDLNLTNATAIAAANITNSTNATAFIIWQTKDVCNITSIVISSDTLNITVNITEDKLWHDSINATVELAKNGGGPAGNYVSYSHIAALTVEPGYAYNYSIYENGTVTAGPYIFNLPVLNNTKENVKFVVYGDIDTSLHNYTLDWLNNNVNSNTSSVDLHLCLGDLAYDIYSENGTRGEYFFNTAQPSISRQPFMISPGNHEYYQNYTFLNFRTKMPLYNMSQNHYYSFNLGKIHFISIDIFFWWDYMNVTEIADQMIAWIENDLILANQNRENRPWIIAYSHKPIYCSENEPTDPEYKRCYAFYNQSLIFEQLFTKYKVDLVLQAHVHYWERMGPVANNKSAAYATWFEENRTNYIINPAAPVYTVEGSAGNAYDMVKNATDLADYSINSSIILGISTVEMINSSCLYYEHVSTADSSIIDHFYLLKGDQYPMPESNPVPTPTGDQPYSKLWLWAILVVILVGVIGWVLYRKYKTKQLDDLQKAINDERGTNPVRYLV